MRSTDPPRIEALYDACMTVERGIGPVTAEHWSRAVALPQFRGGRDFLIAEREGHVVGLAGVFPARSRGTPHAP